MAVLLGEQEFVQPVPARECTLLLEKSKAGSVTPEVQLCESVEAPVESGQKLGQLVIKVDGEQMDAIDLIAANPVERLSVGDIFKRFLSALFLH